MSFLQKYGWKTLLGALLYGAGQACDAVDPSLGIGQVTNVVAPAIMVVGVGHKVDKTRVALEALKTATVLGSKK